MGYTSSYKVMLFLYLDYRGNGARLTWLLLLSMVASGHRFVPMNPYPFQEGGLQYPVEVPNPQEPTRQFA